MDKKTKATYKHNRDKGIMSCPYCDNEKGIRIMPLLMASDESYATRTIVCTPAVNLDRSRYTRDGGCGKGWTEYWNMTDVQKH